jgi:putative hemolysin
MRSRPLGIEIIIVLALFVLNGFFAMAELALHELPKPGDHVVWAGWRFEVVDMDGRRINKIVAQRQPELT